MDESIFEIQSFDRSVVKWEEHLYDLTPVQLVEGLYFKREDYFAPLGYRSINGSKLRQAIWLIDNFIKNNKAKGIVSGSVVGSPQHPMIAAICKHYDIKCLITTGTDKIEEHLYLKMAKNWGAEFYNAKVGYAKALQSTAFKLNTYLYRHEVLETNITVDDRLNSKERVRDFHSIGAYQVKNIPEHIETLIIPAGSCNSITSIMYGIFKYRKLNIKNILFMGIGNNGSHNLKYVPKRLQLIGKADKININSIYNYEFLGEDKLGKINCKLFNLNATGFCSYSDLMPFKYHTIEFHPRYEGKIMNYIKENDKIFKQYLNEKSLFWIVGSAPKMS